MSNIFLNNTYKPLSVEVVQQPQEICNNGLKVNIMELNRLIGLLDRPFDEILRNLDRGSDSSAHSSFFLNEPSSMTNLSSASNYNGNYSDAARVTQDLDHLLNSLSQYKLNQTSSSNLYESNGGDNAQDYLYSEQLRNNRSINSVVDVSIRDAPPRPSVSSPPSIPICVRCNEPIYDNSISALNGYWHQHHFVCRGCDMRLESQVYYVNNDQPFCEACHINLFTDKCAYCGEAILDTSLTALDQYWHPEHFFCTSCQGPFDDEVGFHEQQGKPYCSECYFELFGHRCGSCNCPITTSFLTALGKKWHNECFVCVDCKTPFEMVNFREINGQPYCEQHYHMKMGTICGACNRPIVGSLVSALGKKYHVDCFTCSYCTKRLAKTSFKESKNRPYCTECFAKLCP